ncbi:MAG: NYN domain-containing protein, partial [Candidatus Staskawiczbacteria bacterium]|nr:NYN domain-containing protein [Candidatus Staskawiczbacteria bacterium]
LLLLDWDNFWYSLYNRFGVGEMNIERRIKAVVEWAESIGGLIGGHGFVFAPEHLTSVHREICLKNKFQIMICPKKYIAKAQQNLKSGKPENRVDIVDDAIIDFAKMMAGHPDFKTICLVSGDNDYAPLFRDLGGRGIIRSLAAPTIDSLSRNKELLNLVDTSSITGKKLLLMLDRI